MIAATLFLRAISSHVAHPPPTVRSACGNHILRLLALTVDGPSECYTVHHQSSDAKWQCATLSHDDGEQWTLDCASAKIPLQLGKPDSVFATAMGGAAAPPGRIKAAAPHWPQKYVDDLERRRVSGGGTIAFDATHFLELLATSPMDHPLLFPDAARKLGLPGLDRASELVSAVATSLRCGRVDVSPQAFAELLLRVERAERAERSIAQLRGSSSSGDGDEEDGVWWDGRGRLIGEWPDGELAQVGGRTVSDGLKAAIGKGIHRVTFPPDEPLGLGLGPLALGEQRGAEVGIVDEGGMAEKLGVEESMVLLAIEDEPGISSSVSSASDAEDDDEEEDLSRLYTLPFDSVLAHIDERRDANKPLTIVFDSATPTTKLYAVEMPAVPVFAALAASEARLKEWKREDVDASIHMTTMLKEQQQQANSEHKHLPSPLWSEGVTKAFIGDAGSITCAHADIAPDLELAHQLYGTKFLGVAAHDATRRLLADHAGVAQQVTEEGEDEDEEDEEVVSTSVPTDRPLRMHELALLSDHEMSLVCSLPGDLCVFSSAALHFASNGADDLNAALYHGIVTEASSPRLKEAARRGSSGDDDQLSAEDVLREIGRRENSRCVTPADRQNSVQTILGAAAT